MILRLGAARRDVSPVHPVQLAGFGSRAGALVSDIANPIMVRVAVLTDGDGRRLALVSGEFLNWSTESDPRFRSVVAEHARVAPADILFSATHTHSSPQLSHLHAPILGVADEGYLDFLASRLADAAREAASGDVEVTVTRWVGEHDLAHQRRIDLDLSVDPSPPRIDNRLSVIRFDSDGGTVASFVHYACHPVVSAEHRVSGDFFGFAVAEIERQTGAVVFPLQGCAGDVNPAGDAPYAGIQRATQLGHDMAVAVLDLLTQPGESVATGALSATWASADLPLVGIPTPESLQETIASPGLDGEWARALIANPSLVRPSVECRLQLWSLGTDLQLLALSGEVTSEYGLRIRQASGGTALPVAYSNGMVGYIPTARQIKAGGYEVEQSARCYLLPGTFDPVIERHMNDAVDGLLATVGAA